MRRLAAEDDTLTLVGMDVIWTAELAEAGWILPWEGERRDGRRGGQARGPAQDRRVPGQDLGHPVHQQHPVALVPQGPRGPAAGRLHLGRDDRPGGRERDRGRGPGRAVRGPHRVDQLADRGRGRPGRGPERRREGGRERPARRRDHEQARQVGGRAARYVDQPRGPGAARLRVGAAPTTRSTTRSSIRARRRSPRTSRRTSAGRATRAPTRTRRAGLRSAESTSASRPSRRSPTWPSMRPSAWPAPSTRRSPPSSAGCRRPRSPCTRIRRSRRRSRSPICCASRSTPPRRGR